LTTHLAYTQNTKETVTKEQKQRIENIFDADYIIKSSKTIDNYKDLDSVVKVRDVQIKELNDKIKSLEKEYTKTLKAIAFRNGIAKNASKDIDSINDVQLKYARKKEKRKFNWNIIHLYAGVESREFNFQAIEINAELMIELKRFHFGLKAFAIPNINNNYEAGAGIKLRYKFF